MRPADLGRTLRTARHVPPRQLAHRVRLRAQRAWYARRSDDLEARWASGPAGPTGPARAVGWPAGFDPVDAAVCHPAPVVDQGSCVVSAVGESHDVLRGGWRPAERSQLFRYHLHYFEWVWPLTGLDRPEAQERFVRLWRSWRADTRAGRWDEWSPYVVSLRAWNLCATFEALVRGTEVEHDVVHHLRASLGFLRRNTEFDVGGNHLVKNLKALVGLGVFVDDGATVARSLRRFGDQLAVQVLADGGHFELSPSYHAQVLADVVDVCGLCEAAGVALPFDHRGVIHRMEHWLRSMRFPDGSLPLLGDCTPPPDGLLDRLVGPVRPGAWPVLLVHEGTGHVVVRPDAHTMAVFDFGPTCPPELPAHGQADWGTFELWAHGRTVVCDVGVSTYVGERRRHERSTPAHNTVSIEGGDQSEVWSSFRVGRMGRGELVSAVERDGVVELVGRQYGFERLPGRPVHERRVRVTPDVVRVDDAVLGGHGCSASTSLLLADQACAEMVTGGARTQRWVEERAERFGHLVPGVRLTQQMACPGDGSWEIRWSA
jgi:hypothetical protein